MSEPFLAEIRIVGFDFAPRGWAFCDGQILPINQNQSLYSLLGTTYGGDGRTSFALPDLRGRTPIHVGPGHTLGNKGGEETHTLSSAEMPAHDHIAYASGNDGSGRDPSGQLLGNALNLYAAPANLTGIRSGTITHTGGSQPHENEQPSLVLNYCIALQGLFPSRN